MPLRLQPHCTALAPPLSSALAIGRLLTQPIASAACEFLTAGDDVAVNVGHPLLRLELCNFCHSADAAVNSKRLVHVPCKLHWHLISHPSQLFESQLYLTARIQSQNENERKSCRWLHGQEMKRNGRKNKIDSRRGVIKRCPKGKATTGAEGEQSQKKKLEEEKRRKENEVSLLRRLIDIGRRQQPHRASKGGEGVYGRATAE